jgi:hypothetical protein
MHDAINVSEDKSHMIAIAIAIAIAIVGVLTMVVRQVRAWNHME